MTDEQPTAMPRFAPIPRTAPRSVWPGEDAITAETVCWAKGHIWGRYCKLRGGVLINVWHNKKDGSGVDNRVFSSLAKLKVYAGEREDELRAWQKREAAKERRAT